MCFRYLSKNFTHYVLKNVKKLSVVSRAIIITHTAFLITLACIRRLEFRLLSGRNKMLMLLIILNDFFRHHLPLKTSKCVLDILVIV